MIRRRRFVQALAISAGAGWTSARAASWPSRSIRVIVPFAAGGATDLVARIVCRKMSVVLDQPIVVEDRVGAGGNIGTAMVASAQPDGYRLLVGNVSTNALNPVMYQRVLQIDPAKGLRPITALGALENVLVATNAGTFPPNTMAEFVTYAHEHPGQLNYASAGVGTYAHLDMLVLSRAAKLDMVHVPSVGGAGTSTDIQAGLVHLTFLNAASASVQIRSRLLKPLAVTGPRRLPAFPDVPTLTELGYPGIGTTNWAGLFAPAATADDIVQALHAAAVRSLGDPEVQSLFAANSISPTPSRTPEEFARFVDEERARFRRIVEENKVPLL